MSELTLMTGMEAEPYILYVEWSDHNGILYGATVEIVVDGTDKQRTLRVLVNEVKVAEIASNDRSFLNGTGRRR